MCVYTIVCFMSMSIVISCLLESFMNDLCIVSEMLKFVLFPDEANIFCSGNDLIELGNNTVSKTNYMILEKSSVRNTMGNLLVLSIMTKVLIIIIFIIQ